MSLGWKVLFLRLFATLFRLFVVSLFCLDVGFLVKRSFFTLSDCSMDSVVVVGASVAVVSSVRLGMSIANVTRGASRLAFLPFSSTNSSTHEFGQGRASREFLFSCQGLFDAVPRRTTHSSQGGRFSGCNGGRDEGQEWKETPSLTSFWSFATTHGPFSTSSSSTFGRHDVFETMKGRRYRHTHLGFFLSVPRRRRRRRWPRARLPPPDPDFGGAKRGTLTLRTLEVSDTWIHGCHGWV